MLSKVPRFLLSQARSQRVTPLLGARAAKSKWGPPPSSVSLLARSPCGKNPLANGLPHPHLASHYKVLCHGGNWSRWWWLGEKERQAGGRTGGPVKGQNLSRRNISAHTLPGRITRQKHQRVLLNIRQLVIFVWDGAI